MDYKKKYEGLIKNIEHLHESVNPEWKRTIECYIPELKENEDEKIRKEVIDILKLNIKGAESQMQASRGVNRTFEIYACNKVIAWLEKQGESLCWIKCSDELPNRDGTYLVVTDGSQNDVYDMAKYDSIDGWHKASEILYWMPIPQLNNKSIVEQKPAWSEEDKLKMDTLIHVITNQKGSVIFEGFLPEELVNWLKSLRGRVQPQPNKDWSQEDEMMVNDIIKAIDTRYAVSDYNEMVSWLKSLKERCTWKPSDEQMATFWDAICNLNHDGYKWINNMKLLYQDLEKLREE